MSTEKGYDVEKMLTRIKNIKNLDNWSSVASYFGVTQATLSAWKARNSQVAVKYVTQKCKEDVDLQEVMFNIAEYFVDNQQTRDDYIPVDYRRIDVDLQLTDQETAQLVTNILTSQSELNKAALTMSVKALWKACQGEIEMSDLKMEMAAMREEMRMGRGEMMEMMEMMRALLPGVQKKRDAQAGN